MEIARDSDRHVKKTLPPTLTGYPGEVDIRYFLKATVQRPAFYKENFRVVRENIPFIHILKLISRTDGTVQIPSY